MFPLSPRSVIDDRKEASGEDRTQDPPNRPRDHENHAQREKCFRSVVSDRKFVHVRPSWPVGWGTDSETLRVPLWKRQHLRKSMNTWRNRQTSSNINSNRSKSVTTVTCLRILNRGNHFDVCFITFYDVMSACSLSMYSSYVCFCFCFQKSGNRT